MLLYKISFTNIPEMTKIREVVSVEMEMLDKGQTRKDRGVAVQG